MQLELVQISKTFGPLKANAEITYTFAEGKTYAILGENGAGKSTLMKIIAGYQAPDAGGILRVNREAVFFSTPNDALSYGIGMLYQDPLDFPPMTVLENFITARPKQGLLPNWSQARQELQRVSQRFGFKLSPDALIETLTIGERQQLEIVRLLSLGVKFLILDEPTTGISEEQRQTLFSTLKQLAHEDQMTIAIVTHKLADVEALCDEGFVLRHGRMTGAFSTPIPAAELVRMMFGETPPLSPKPKVPLGEPVLKVQDLTVRTPLFTIPKVNLEVKAGEVIGLAGLDGSGQVDFMRACAGFAGISWRNHAMSVVALLGLLVVFDYLLDYSRTVFVVASVLVAVVALAPLLMSLLNRLLDPHEAIFFRGQPIRWFGYEDLRGQGLVYLSAGRLEEGLIAGLTLTQHFALTFRAAFINWGARLRQTQAAIQTFDIRGQATSPIQTLSGGNQQRVALALLPNDLHLAFLENPTRGLDVHSARHIWSLLLKRRKTGTAIVFASPDLDEILQYSDRVVVFSSGRYQLVEHPEQLNAEYLGLLIGGKTQEGQTHDR